MRRIEVVEQPCESVLFSIDKVAFRYNQENKKQMIKYQVELDLPDYKAIDVRLLLEDIDEHFDFFLMAPEELIEYMKKYEESNNPNDEFLFHDLRTKYVDFIRNRIDDEGNIQDEIIILGYSLLDKKIYLVIKAFSLKGLSAFLQKLTTYCLKNSIKMKTEDDIRWVELKAYMLETNEEKSNGSYKDFLNKTLVKSNFERFREIFQQIDNEGYFGKSFYDRVMFQKRKNEEGKEIRVPVSQVSKYFAPYWKYNIDVNNKSKDILCLHDEMPTDEKVNDYVYTFKPSLMRYYLKNWFEDFSVEIIKKIDIDECRVTYILPGKKFNFFADGNEDNTREIDVVLGVEKESCLKLIAIECKKTLSNKEIQTTNKKCREKVINSGNNVFDAFIHIGCFKGDVDFDKRIEGSREKYKQSILEGTGGNMDVPYYAFVIKSIDDYEMKLAYILTDVFKNW